MDVVRVMLPSGTVWHALLIGDLQTLCGLVPLRSSVDAAVDSQKEFPPAPHDRTEFRLSRSSCERCLQLAQEMGGIAGPGS